MTLLTVFYIIGIVFGVFFLFLNGAAFFGGDADMDMDGDGIADVDGDFDVDGGPGGIWGEALTLRGLINFLTFFGWVGVYCLESGFDALTSVIWATLVGMVLTVVFAAVMFGFKRLQATPKDIDNFDVVGKVATVYLVIPGKDGKGKVQMSVRGALRTIDAISETGEKIDTNAQVVVTEFISDNLLKVKRLN